MLCTICMRGGSKGVPNKNLREMHGKPLMAYTIEQALASGLFEHVVVSTDSEKIASTAKKYGAETWFLRPAKMATDEAPKLPVIRHAFLEAEKHYGRSFDVVLDLDATAPVRYVDDITGAFRQFQEQDADILITACPARKNPYFNMVVLDQNGYAQLAASPAKTIYRRQDAPDMFDMTTVAYAMTPKFLLEANSIFEGRVKSVLVPDERALDIDSELDFKFAEFLLSQRVAGNPAGNAR